MKDLCTVFLAALVISLEVLHLSCGNEHYSRDKIGKRGLRWKTWYKEAPAKRGKIRGLRQMLTGKGSHETIDHITGEKSIFDKVSLRSKVKGEVIPGSDENKKRSHQYRSSQFDRGVSSISGRMLRQPGPIKSKGMGHFETVPKEHFKVKPRQQIEVVDDNQGQESKQGDYGYPSYEGNAANEDSQQNSNQNGFSNNYITIIDNVDNQESDPYRTLSSDAAKNEYTNVENSMNEGANEESELFGKEVDDVLGALTKSDSRIGQMVNGRQHQMVGESHLQPTSAAFANKANEENLEENGNRQNSPSGRPSDVTIFEDNEDENANTEPHPYPTQPTWDAPVEAEKEYTHQNENTQTVISTDSNQNQISGKETESDPYLPTSKMSQGDKDPRHPGSAVGYLESSLDMFGGSKAQNGVGNTTTKNQNAQSNGDKPIVLTGEAEEGSHGNASLAESDRPENEFPLDLEDGRPSANFRNVSLQGTFLKIPLNLPPERNPNGETFGSEVEVPYKVDNNDANFSTNQSNGLNADHGPYSDSSMLNDIETQPGEMSKNDGKDQNTNAVDTSDLSNAAISHENNQTGSGTMHSKSPVGESVTDRVKFINQNSDKGQGAEENNLMNKQHGMTEFSALGAPLSLESHDGMWKNSSMSHSRPQSSDYDSGKEPAPDEGKFFTSDRPSVLLGPQNTSVHNPPGLDENAKSFDQAEHDTQPVPPSLTPASQASASSAPLYEGSYSVYHKPHADWQNENQNGQLPKNRNTKMKPQSRNNAAFSSGNSDHYQHLRQQKLPFERAPPDKRPLNNWSLEYKNLMTKLKDLYGQARENFSHKTTTNNNFTINDAQHMMKEVSRFHMLLFNTTAGKFSGDKGMFFKDLKGDEKGKDWNTTAQTLSTDDLPLLPIKGYNGQIDAASKILPTNDKDQEETPQVTKGKPVSHQMVYDNPSFSDSDRSGASLPKGGQSLHQVLVSYFRNETELRKRLQGQMNASNSLQPQSTSIQGRFGLGKALHNDLFGNRTQNKGPEVSDQSSQDVGMFDSKSESSYPKNVSSDLTRKEDTSLAKYIEEFIAMVNPNKSLAFWKSNDSSLSSEEQQSESENDPRLTQMFPEKISEASKKENVTDLKNRIIIEVSHKSLKELIKNRRHNSSVQDAPKPKPGVPGEVEHITANPAVVINKTVDSEKGQFKSRFSDGPGTNQTHRHPDKKKSYKPNKSDSTLVNEDEDLNLLYRKELKSLEISLSRDFMTNWIYYQRSLNEIGITPSMLRSGIANLGSAARLKRVFRKTLAGTDLNVLVVGGSISAGGGLERDRGNVEGVYHRAFTDWWNNTVTPITTSELKINTVAIGGTDSEYFAYCIKNYMRDLPDIVIWELAANDYKRYLGRNFVPAKPLEQLTRIILNLPSRPALIFANFFRGDYYKTTVGQDCPDSEDEGGKTIAQYYKLTSLSWRSVICSPETDKVLPLKKLFSSDGYHPSILGHAQMSTLLISYLKGVFEETISQEMTALKYQDRQSQQDKELPTLPGPIFDDPVIPRPLCWTLLTPDYGQRLRNTLPDLEFTEANGFQFSNVSHWPIRRDRLRCLRAIQPGAILKMKFLVPSPEGSDDIGVLNSRASRELAVTTHNSYGGIGELWLDDNEEESKIISEKAGQKRTQVDILTRNLKPGTHTLTVVARQLGFCLSAVAVL